LTYTGITFNFSNTWHYNSFSLLFNFYKNSLCLRRIQDTKSRKTQREDKVLRYKSQCRSIFNEYKVRHLHDIIADLNNGCVSFSRTFKLFINWFFNYIILLKRIKYGWFHLVPKVARRWNKNDAFRQKEKYLYFKILLLQYDINISRHRIIFSINQDLTITRSLPDQSFFLLIGVIEERSHHKVQHQKYKYNKKNQINHLSCRTAFHHFRNFGKILL